MKQAHILIFIISLFLSIGGFSQQKTDTIKLKESYGLRVAIVPQPSVNDNLQDFTKLGIPKMFFAVTLVCGGWSG